MIYFTKNAIEVMKKKFFYLETADGKKSILYKQDKESVQEALKKPKYKLMYNFYSFLDQDMKENNVYLLGIANKEELQKKIFKILEKEKLNVIFVPIGATWNMLFLTDCDKEKEKYTDYKTENTAWPWVIANGNDINFLKTKIKPENELLQIINGLCKI